MKTLKSAIIITLVLFTSFAAKAGSFFVEKDQDINSIENVDSDYYYDTSEHTKTISIGYMTDSLLVSVSHLSSKHLDDSYSLTIGAFVEEEKIKIRAQAGIKLVSDEYYPSSLPLSVGDYHVVPFGKVTYTGFGSIQPSLSIDSNNIFTFSVSYVF